MVQAEAFLASADSAVKELAPPAKAAVLQVQTLAALEEGRPAEIAGQVEEMAREMSAPLSEIKHLTMALRKTTEPDAPGRVQFDLLIEELADAARAVREAADYLQTHPESLIRGKGRE